VSRLDQILTWVENFLAAASLATAAAISISSVLARFIFGGGIFWSEEAVIFLIIFSTFIGTVITLRHNEHVNVDILPALLGPRGKWFFNLLAGVLIVVYCAAIGGYGWVLITQPAARNTVTPALQMPLWVVELALPIGLTVLFLRSLELVYRTARGQRAFAEAEEDEFADERPDESLTPELDREDAERGNGRRDEGGNR
jgi:C4-dicarboxylate transporter, DctQ subunit